MNKQELKERYLTKIDEFYRNNPNTTLSQAGLSGMLDSAFLELDFFDDYNGFNGIEKKNFPLFNNGSTQQIYDFIKLLDNNFNIIPDSIQIQIYTELITVVNKYKKAIESV